MHHYNKTDKGDDFDFAVKVSDLTAGYRRKKPLFKSINMVIPRGATGVLGPNGAGKTTLLDLINGLQRPASGSIEIAGMTLEEATSRRIRAARIGYLPQNFGYLPSYKVAEFVAYAAWLKKVPPRILRSSVERALASVSMNSYADAPMRTLSGGMVRRVGIATAIVHSPELVILDEPSSGLDPQQQVQLRSLVRSLAQEHSVLLSTHLVSDLEVACTNVIVLEGGHVRFAGSVRALAALDSRRGSVEAGYLRVLTGGKGSV